MQKMNASGLWKCEPFGILLNLHNATLLVRDYVIDRFMNGRIGTEKWDINNRIVASTTIIKDSEPIPLYRLINDYGIMKGGVGIFEFDSVIPKKNFRLGLIDFFRASEGVYKSEVILLSNKKDIRIPS
jgi:hypothetical protein